MLEVAGDEVGDRFAFDGAVAGEQVVEDAAHRIDVGAGVERLVAELLGGDVEDRAVDGLVAFHALHGRLGHEAREAEIEDLVLPRPAGEARAHDVLRFQVAVDHPRLVRGDQRLQRLLRGVGELVHAERGVLDDGIERLAVHEFGDDVGTLVVHAEIVDREDVGMLDRGEGHRLAPEALGALGIVEHRLRRTPALDGHEPLQLEIPGLEDRSGAARADGAADLVALRDLFGGGSVRRVGGRIVLFHAAKTSEKVPACRVRSAGFGQKSDGLGWSRY